MQLGTKSDEMGWAVYEMCRQQGAIIATAHEHTYERTKTLTNIQGLTVDTTQHPLVSGVPGNQNSVLVAPGKTFVFVSGLGGNGPRNQDRCLPTTYPYGGGTGCNYIWANVWTTDQGGSSPFGALFITFNVDGNPNKARGYFKNVAGQVIDQFEIAKSSTPVTGQPTPTPTPQGPTATPTRTPTPGSPTATRTPTPGGPTATRTATPKLGIPTPTPKPGMCTIWKGFNGDATPTPTPPTSTSTPTPTGSLNPTPTLTPTPLGPTSTPAPPPPPGAGIFISRQEISQLPMSGSGWSDVLSAANSPVLSPNLSQRDLDNTNTYAKALVYARTGDTKYAREVRQILQKIMGTERGNDVLAVLRNTYAYVLSADIINLRSFDASFDQTFRNWLSRMRATNSSCCACNNIIDCHEKRANNFAGHALASRVAIGLYLNDTSDFNRAINVHKAWLGMSGFSHSFSWGGTEWQCNPSRPVGINPAGCAKQGRTVDGVLPDDQRRSGGFSWPPPCENYVWGALNGYTVASQMLHRAGQPAWEWADKAMLRALKWLHAPEVKSLNWCRASGNDTWVPYLVNSIYGTNFPASPSFGTGLGFTAWTHAR